MLEGALLPSIYAHSSGGDLDPGIGILASWTWKEPTLLVILAVGILYARGLRNWPHPRPMKPWRPYFFYAGLAFLVIALVSPIDALSDDLFFMHMIQHLLMVMVAPPLLLLGAPTTPLLRGVPKFVLKGVVAPLMRNQEVRSSYRFLTYAGTVWVLFSINMWAWHFYGGAYERATQNAALHIFMHWTFITTATLFWWVVIDPRPLRSRIPYPLRLIFLGVTMFQNVALGAGITFQTSTLYPYYATRARLWDISPLSDQQAGGLVMWIIGTMMIMTALLITTAIWLDREEKRSRKEEAKMDALMAASMSSGSSELRPGGPGPS